MENENKEISENVESEGLTQELSAEAPTETTVEETVKEETAEVKAEETTETAEVKTEETTETAEVKVEEATETEEVKTEETTETEEVKVEEIAKEEQITGKTDEVKENVTEATVQNNTVKAPKEKKKGKKVGLIIGIIAAILAVLVIFIIIIILVIVLVVNRKTTVDVAEFMHFSERGYDGYGEAEIDIDEDKFFDEYAGIRIKRRKLKALLKDEITAQGFLEEEAVLKTVENIMNGAESSENGYSNVLLSFLEDGSLSQEEDLCNGQEITYNFNVSQEELEKAFRIKLENYDSLSYTVYSLTEVEEFDAFENIEISFSGIAPKGRLEVSKDFYDDYTISFDKITDLSNGDVITATVDFFYENEKKFVEHTGTRPIETTKTITVEGLPEYVTSAAQISNDGLDKMKKQAEDTLVAYASSHKPYDAEEFEIQNISYIGNYFMKRKEESSYENNNCYLVYKIRYKVSLKEDKTKKIKDVYCDIYNYVKFSNVLIDGDGSAIVDLTEARMGRDSFNYETDVLRSKFLGLNYSLNLVGYNSIDTLYSDVVTSSIDEYNHEDNVTDISFDENAGETPEAEPSTEEVPSENAAE